MDTYSEASHSRSDCISRSSIRGYIDPVGKKKPEIKQMPAPYEVKGADVEELDPAANDDSSGN
jgi:hypothetical protein